MFELQKSADCVLNVFLSSVLIFERIVREQLRIDVSLKYYNVLILAKFMFILSPKFEVQRF